MTINVDDIETEIRLAKNQIRSACGDLKQGFAALNSLIDEQIAEIEQIVADGDSPIPVTSLAELDAQEEAFHDLVRRRGCVIVRNVFSEHRVNGWNDTLMSYVHNNGYFEKQAEKAGMDKYFSELASDKPQIFGLYWSRPQMEARTSQELAKVRSWLNRLWKFNSQNGAEFDPDLECLYADRLRQREPGDKTLGLSPHVDGGSVERWIDPGYRNVYRHVFTGDIGAYDPFDAAYRTTSQEIPSPAVCSVFRTYQGWTALSQQGPGDGTLNLVPISRAMGWMLLRALQGDITDEDLCGAAPGRAMVVSEAHHAKLLRAYVPIPVVRPGDTVWWHPDVIHGVEDNNRNKGYSNVMYIGAAPDCEKNRRFLDRQRPAFENGMSCPDFAAEDYEVDFKGRFMQSDLDALGLRQMGYEA